MEHVTEQQEGISARAAVGQMKTLLGLPTDAPHQAVLEAVQEMQSVTGDWYRVVAVLGMDTAVVEDVVERVAEMARRDIPAGPADMVMTEAGAERQRTTRQEALHTVLDLWSQHQWGEDPPSVDDLVLAAEWLSTGDMSAVVRVRQMWVEEARRHAGSPDAATWTADHE